MRIRFSGLSLRRLLVLIFLIFSLYFLSFLRTPPKCEVSPEDVYFPEKHIASKKKPSSPQLIPRTIYQTNDKRVLKHMMNALSSWTSLNPEYEYFYFDSEAQRRFIKDNYEEEVLQAYDKLIPGAYKADLWRYCILYKLEGLPLQNVVPFIVEPVGRQRLQEGKPIQVLSCWNGVVVVTAKAFYQGLRFTAGWDTGCPTSECTLFCLDMWKYNHTRIIMDPLVRVAYTYKEYEAVDDADWIKEEVDTSIVYPLPVFAPMPKTFTCCPDTDNINLCQNQTLTEWQPR